MESGPSSHSPFDWPFHMAKHREGGLDGSSTLHAYNLLRAVPAAEVGALLRHHPAGLAVLLHVGARLAPEALRRIALRRCPLATLADGQTVHREPTLDVRRVAVRTLFDDDEVRVLLELVDVTPDRRGDQPLASVVGEDEDGLALRSSQTRHLVPFVRGSLAHKYIIPAPRIPKPT